MPPPNNFLDELAALEVDDGDAPAAPSRNFLDDLASGRLAPPYEFSGPPAPVEDTRPWYQQGLDTKPGSRFTSPRDLARVAVGAADLVDYGLSAAGDQVAGTLSGVIGAIDPNDTYVGARDRFRQENEQAAARIRTGGGEALARGAADVMGATGIPQMLGPIAEFAQENFPATADLAATALILAPSTRLLKGVPDGVPTRRVVSEAGDRVTTVPVDPNAPVRLGGTGGAAARNVDLESIRDPALRAELSAKSAAGTLNPEVAQAHLAADRLGLEPLTKGQALKDPRLISEEWNRRSQDPRAVDKFNAQRESAVSALDRIRARETPNVVGNDPVQNGQALVDSYKKYDETVKADIGVKYDALREAMKANDVAIDHQTFLTTANSALKEAGVTHWLPSEVRGLLKDAEAGMTFRDFETMRTVLAKEARGNPNGNARAAAGAVRNALEGLPLVGPAAETLKPLADAARASYAARAKRLELDPAYRAVADDDVALGEVSPLSGDFVQKYVVRGKPGNVDIMRQTLGNDPVASETITAGALNYLKSKTGIDPYTGEGNFSQAGYNRALAELTPRVRELMNGDTADDLRALGDYARATQQTSDAAYMNRSNTAAALRSELPGTVVDMALNAKGLPGVRQVQRGLEKVGLKKSDVEKFYDDAFAPGAGLDAPRLNRLLRPQP